MRRANGTGNVVRLTGNRRRPYAVRVSCLDRRGRVRQKYLSYHATVAEAQAALAVYVAGRPAPADVLTMTVAQVYEAWCARKLHRVSASVAASYRSAWGHLGTLASHRMRDLCTDDLQQIIDRMERDGMGRASMEKIRGLLRELYKYAMERDIVSKDFTAYLELPEVGPKYERGTLSEAQLQTVAELATAGVLWADTVLFLCYTGFRVGEFLALTPASYHADGRYLVGGSKTKAGKDRIVPVHPRVLPILLRWLDTGGPCIFHKDGARMTSDWYRDRAFGPVMDQIGLPQATPHWCRHTCASRLRAAGADELAIKRILGHADKDITEHYTHFSVELLTQEMNKMQ